MITQIVLDPGSINFLRVHTTSISLSRCSSILTTAVSNTSLDSSATAVPNDVDGDRKINTSAANVGDLVRIAVKPKGLSLSFKDLLINYIIASNF